MQRAQEALLNLTSALGIDTRGLADDVLEVIALRIVTEDVLPTKPNVERVIDEVKRAEGTNERGLAAAGQAPAETPMSAGPSAHRPYRFNATEASESKYRQRLAQAHRTEDSRTGLYLVPRRPEVLRPGAVHPACQAAYAEDADPCARCKPLLHPAVCGCDTCEEWWSAVDDA
jgi:hypothetical protein